MWLKTKTEVRIRRFGIIQIKTRKIERPPDQVGQADTHYCYDENDFKSVFDNEYHKNQRSIIAILFMRLILIFLLIRFMAHIF